MPATLQQTALPHGEGALPNWVVPSLFSFPFQSLGAWRVNVLGILVLLVFSQNGSLSRTYATGASILLDFKPEIISSFKSQAPSRYIWWDLFETDFVSNLDDSRGEDRVERLVNFSRLRVLLFLLIPMEIAWARTPS